jgi:hypothetical protein
MSIPDGVHHPDHPVVMALSQKIITEWSEDFILLDTEDIANLEVAVDPDKPRPSMPLPCAHQSLLRAALALCHCDSRRLGMPVKCESVATVTPRTTTQMWYKQAHTPSSVPCKRTGRMDLLVHSSTRLELMNPALV